MSNLKELKKLNGLAKNEACKFGKLAKDQKFFVGNMNVVDKDGTLEVPLETLHIVADEFRQRAPDTALMLITVSEKLARVHLSIPESRTELTEAQWIASTSMGGPTKQMADGEFLKFRDQVINEAITFLKSNNLLEEESDDEVCYTFDD